MSEASGVPHDIEGDGVLVTDGGNGPKPSAGSDAEADSVSAPPGLAKQPESTRKLPGEKSSGKAQRKPKCRFFGTKKGCRAGASCPFRHDPDSESQQEPVAYATASGQVQETVIQAPSAARTGVDHVPKTTITALSQKPLSKPPLPAQRPFAIAQQQDPRAFQINQITRRFSPKEESAANGNLLLHIEMRPSDPDFPFDIDTLKCTLRIPQSFPTQQRPSLRVTNKEMERGYQVNVEHGFDAIWSQSSAPTLLNAMKVLDRQLEALLTAQKAEIFKIVANAGPRPDSAPVKPQDSVNASPPIEIVPKPATVARPPPISAARREQAWTRRAAEVQILEHRLGRDPKFSKGLDGTMFMLPIEPQKRNELPLSLRAVKSVRLLVPTDYDVEPCTMKLVGVEEIDATKVEEAFDRRAKTIPEPTLLAQVNYLAANMHIMAKEPRDEPSKQTTSTERPAGTVATTSEPDVTMPAPVTREIDIRETEKAHVKIIARPPEWDAVAPEGEESDIEEYSDSVAYTDSEADSQDENEGEEKEEAMATSSTPHEKGIMISFPGLELHNIELLELILINLTVRCERCKDSLDVSRIRPHDSSTSSTSAAASTTKDATVNTHCKKCAYPFSIGYRKDILHANSTRAGYLDLDGCTVLDLLPSSFLPTCASCSTPFPQHQAVTAVRAQSALGICRTCHAKLSFNVPDVKFLRVSTTAGLPLKQVGRPKKESLGIITGTELPDRGRCKHYGKSYRWFRFSCCNKVFPCDKCHDLATDHPNEFAARMICGWCSREQPYRPEDCGMQGCRRGITGRVRTGFWEGGKGTRDKARMSRKDPRKYKRRGGTAVGPAAKK